MAKQLFIILSITILSQQALSCNALRAKAFRPELAEIYKQQELNIDRKQIQGRKSILSKENFNAIAPLNLRTTNDGNLVRDEILKKTGNAIVKSRFIQESFLMKTAKRVENKTKMDLSIKSKKTTEGRVTSSTNAKSVAEPSIEHKFKFDVQALQKHAKLIYSGFVDSRIEYRAENDQFKISLEEKLSENSKIALTHDKNSFGSQQYVQYNLSW